MSGANCRITLFLPTWLEYVHTVQKRFIDAKCPEQSDVLSSRPSKKKIGKQHALDVIIRTKFGATKTHPVMGMLLKNNSKSQENNLGSRRFTESLVTHSEFLGFENAIFVKYL